MRNIIMNQNNVVVNNWQGDIIVINNVDNNVQNINVQIIDQDRHRCT